MGDHEELSRRDVIRQAVAVGGVAGLSACLSAESDDEAATATDSVTDALDVQRGREDLSSLPTRQHAWNEFLVTNRHGNTTNPQHQLLVFLEYPHDTVSDGDRRTVDEALQTLERAFQRGTGGNGDAVLNRGLLSTLGYSPAYFERVSTGVPAGIDVQSPARVLEALDSDQSLAENYDALLVLAGDMGSIVLAAEQAMFGDVDDLNGVAVTERLNDVFDVAERRTGFVGKGLPAEKLDNDDISEAAPLSMGYRSNYRDTQPPESKVTIDSGPFAGGTTQMVSRLTLDLNRWYDQSEDERVAEMFSPAHTPEEVGETGTRLGDDSDIDDEAIKRIPSDATQHARLGHGQKAAKARDADGDPLILRRSESISQGEDGPEFNFTSVQRGLSQFLETRKAMDGRKYDDAVDDADHGIRSFIEVTSRATFLLPPRGRRALPTTDG